VNTTPIPASVDAARRVLAAVLAADPLPEDALAVSEALSALVDVHPPYPPLGAEDDPTEPDVGIPTALAYLDEALNQADDIISLCRYGEVMVLLRRAPGARPADQRPAEPPDTPRDRP
jgi:hypothetical protein